MRLLTPFLLALLGTAGTAIAQCNDTAMERLADINTSPKEYAVWYGTLTATGPVSDDGTVPLRLEGENVVDTQQGITVNFTGKAACSGGLCTPPDLSEKALVYVEFNGNTAVLDLASCPRYIFSGISDSDMADIRTEMRGIMGHDSEG